MLHWKILICCQAPGYGCNMEKIKRTTVLVIKNWTHPDLSRQSPKGTGRWENVEFTLNPDQPYSYVVVLNYAPAPVTVAVDPMRIWTIQQEPPYDVFRVFHKAPKQYFRVFTTDQQMTGDRYVHTQPALPWHIDKTYDELRSLAVPQKKWPLSFITSMKKEFEGHKKRIRFWEDLRTSAACHLVATDSYYENIYPELSKQEREKKLLSAGFTHVVAGKWEGLAPYRYSISIENYHGPDYWSEKLADCFLSWTVPLYYGCTNLSDYFPEDSYIAIDIEEKNTLEKIRGIIEKDDWKKRLPAIKKARELILGKYQFYPFVANRIKEWEKEQQGDGEKMKVRLPKGDSFFRLALHKIKRSIFPRPV